MGKPIYTVDKDGTWRIDGEKAEDVRIKLVAEREVENRFFRMLEETSKPSKPSKVIEFPRQLELPLVWWNDSELWKEWHLARAHSIALEDEVLEDVYWETKALASRNYVRQLTPLQRRIDDELQRFNTKSGYTEAEKAKLVAKAVNRPISVVLEQMDVIVYTMRYIAKTDHLMEKIAKRRAAWECLKEISAEKLVHDAAA